VAYVMEATLFRKVMGAGAATMIIACQTDAMLRALVSKLSRGQQAML
jgi:hypothetical protein